MMEYFSQTLSKNSFRYKRMHSLANHQLTNGMASPNLSSLLKIILDLANALFGQLAHYLITLAPELVQLEICRNLSCVDVCQKCTQ